MGERRGLYRFGGGGGTRRERDHLEDPGIEGRIIFRHFFKKWGYGLDRNGSG
jgi:hypothetical protein